MVSHAVEFIIPVHADCAIRHDAILIEQVSVPVSCETRGYPTIQLRKNRRHLARRCRVRLACTQAGMSNRMQQNRRGRTRAEAIDVAIDGGSGTRKNRSRMCDVLESQRLQELRSLQGG